MVDGYGQKDENLEKRIVYFVLPKIKSYTWIEMVSKVTKDLSLQNSFNEVMRIVHDIYVQKGLIPKNDIPIIRTSKSDIDIGIGGCDNSTFKNLYLVLNWYLYEEGIESYDAYVSSDINDVKDWIIDDCTDIQVQQFPNHIELIESCLMRAKVIEVSKNTQEGKI